MVKDSTDDWQMLSKKQLGGSFKNQVEPINKAESLFKIKGSAPTGKKCFIPIKVREEWVDTKISKRAVESYVKKKQRKIVSQIVRAHRDV